MSDAAINFTPSPYAPPDPRPAPGYRRTLHVLALLTACATFPLIFLGGLVTSHQAGMSVPDWPNSYGYNMFTFPPSQWVGGILYEHTHRLLGTLVGFFATLLFLSAHGWGRNPRTRRTLLAAGLAVLVLTIVAVFVPVLRRTHLFELFAFVAVVLTGAGACRRPEPRRWVRRLTLAVLVGVIIQGFLGGFRVRLAALPLAVIHGCFAQAFFCLAAFASVVTSRWWLSASARDAGASGSPGGAAAASAELFPPAAPPRLARAAAGPERASGWTVRVAAAAVVAVFLQLVVGALMRHYGAGLAIPDVPLAYGHVLPPAGEASLKLANEVRVYDLRLPRVTLFQVWVHFTHRIGAVVVATAVVMAAVSTVRRHRAGACPGIMTGLFAASLIGLLSLGAAHAVGSKIGWRPGAVCFATAVLSGFAARWCARRLGSARPLLVPAILTGVLLTVQVTLGVLTVLLRKPADVASAHVGVGALLLVTAFILTVRTARTTVSLPAGNGESAPTTNFHPGAAGVATA